MAAMNGDKFTFLNSTASSNNQPVYTSKQWAYQVDQNSASYSSKQIIFDLSGFYNSQRFIDPSEMFMVFPVVTTLTALGTANANDQAGLGAAPFITTTFASSKYADNGGAITDQYAMGFKSGFWHLINSIQIQVDGKDVIQLTPNINYHASFVANTTWSETDLQKHGSDLGFYPDTSDSWHLNNTGSFTNYGYGICNNGLPPANKKDIFPGFNPENITGAGGSFLGSLPFPVDSQYAPCSMTSDANMGLWERMKSTNFMNPQLNYTVDQLGQLNALLPPSLSHRTILADSLGFELDNYVVSEQQAVYNNNDGVGTHIKYDVTRDAGSRSAFRQMMTTCIVRFKDVCNLFSELPLTRGLYMRVIINMNTGNLVVGASGILDIGAGHAIDSFPIYSGINQNTFPGTCPIMLSPLVVSAPSAHTQNNNFYPLPLGLGLAGALTGGGAVVAADGFTADWITDSNIQIYPGVAVDSGTVDRTALVASVSIAKPDPIHVQLGLNAGVGLQDHKLSQCRIYAPIIDMEPNLVSAYITQHKEQAIYYRDVLFYSYPGVSSMTDFTFQIANGIVNAKRLIIMPFYHDETPFVGATSPGVGVGYPIPYPVPFEPNSPFDSAPGTVAPQCALANFNVLISNMNIFQRNINYGFENFIEEIAPANAINGGLDTGCTSGLIDYKKWVQNYRYYVVDLSRRLAGDNTPKSLTVIAKNNTQLKVDYLFFVEYERHLSLDIESGHVSVSSN